MAEYAFELPAAPSSGLAHRGTARVFTHKGEWLQGPIPIVVNGEERYTIGVFSLLDDLNSAYADVRMTPVAGAESADFVPSIQIAPNGWNEGEVFLVRCAVLETWNQLARGKRCSYQVYGYHDIRVGAGSGSSSALVQAAIRATAAEHVPELSDEQLLSIHAGVETAVDWLHLDRPAVVSTRFNLGRPVRGLGERNPHLWAVTWTAGEPVRTASVQFRYDDEDLLLWRVRWASVERAVRYGDDARVARLATESARENEVRNPKLDLALLEAAIAEFGALGFAVAHTGSYHTALYAASTEYDQLLAYKHFVLTHTNALRAPDDPLTVDIFDTAEAAQRRATT